MCYAVNQMDARSVVIVFQYLFIYVLYLLMGSVMVTMSIVAICWLLRERLRSTTGLFNNGTFRFFLFFHLLWPWRQEKSIRKTRRSFFFILGTVIICSALTPHPLKEITEKNDKIWRYTYRGSKKKKIPSYLLFSLLSNLVGSIVSCFR